MNELNDGSALWQCLELSNEIISAIEQIYKFHHQRNNENIREILQTIEKLKNVLASFSTKQPKNTAFDFFVSGIKLTLLDMNKNLQNFEIELPHAEFIQWELNVLRQDLLLSYRIDQLSSVFTHSAPNASEISNLIFEKSAVAFWTHNFSKDVLLVPWKYFLKSLENYLSIKVKGTENEMKLKNFLDFTRDNFVTPFEFGLFLRWFGPLGGCYQRLITAIDSGMLAGFIPGYEAELALQNKESKTYLIRFSKTNICSFALVFVNAQFKISQCLITTLPPNGIQLGDVKYHDIVQFANGNPGKLSFPANYSWLGAKEDVHENNGKDPFFNPPPPSPEKAVDDKLCVVCLDLPQKTVFLECGHMCCCEACSKKLTKCPICRNIISRVISVFQIQ